MRGPIQAFAMALVGTPGTLIHRPPCALASEASGIVSDNRMSMIDTEYSSGTCYAVACLRFYIHHTFSTAASLDFGPHRTEDSHICDVVACNTWLVSYFSL